MRLWFHRALFWIWFITRGYYLWSRFYRWAFERKWRNQDLTQYRSLEELETALGNMRWDRDALKGKLDVISSPEKVEAIYRSAAGDPAKALVGDCDEFAVYAAVAIEDMVRRGVPDFSEPGFMTLNWLDADRKFHGHNVCTFRNTHSNKWGHIGNWFNGRAQIAFDTLEELAAWWADQAGGVLIAWAIASPDLKRLLRIQVEDRQVPPT